MRAWQYNSVSSGLEKNLKLNNIPPPIASASQNLVRTIAVALNPVDYKPAEIPLIGRLLVPRAATPGIDFAGVLVKPASSSDLKAGQLVFGVAGTKPFAAGGVEGVYLRRGGLFAEDT